MVFPVYALGKQKGTPRVCGIPLKISKLRLAAAIGVLATDVACIASISCNTANNSARDRITTNQCRPCSTDAGTQAD